MAISLKCRMCGGNLAVADGESTAECEYCGSRQTVPQVDDEKLAKLYERAGRLLRACEFDKAASVFEQVVAADEAQAEAYWGLFLCRYGIEYVEDPGSGERIPTCHRSSFECAMDDEDLELACENADSTARRLYRDQAKEVERLRCAIAEVSVAEEPYDIFICYKETDPVTGERTLDSVIAQEVYDVLTDEGYRVFFSRITLEDKIGTEYEPYIFAALNSAKVMLAFGTDYEFYNAVWVKNEWSRFLRLAAKDKSKHLIPCYKGVDPYDMPKEFARLQAQDMGKIGAMQDLLRGLRKLIGRIGIDVAEQQQGMRQVVSSAPQAEALLKRASMFLEDGEWAQAATYCERVLDLDPECAEAYFYKLLSDLKLTSRESLNDYPEDFSSNPNCKKASRFNTAIRDEIEEALKAIKNRQLDGVQTSKQFLRNAIGKAKLKIVSNREEQRAKRRLVSEQDIELLAQKRSRVRRIESKIISDPLIITALDESGCVSVALLADTPSLCKGQDKASDWTDVSCIGSVHQSNLTIGFRRDQGPLYAGVSSEVKEETKDWRDVKQFESSYLTYGLVRALTADGHVLTAGKIETDHFILKGIDLQSCALTSTEAMSDIAELGLTYGGRYICRRNDGFLASTPCDIDTIGWGEELSGWSNLVSIARVKDRLCGIKDDGSVVVSSLSEKGKPFDSESVIPWTEICAWENIVSLVQAGPFLYGLTDFGTVLLSPQLFSLKSADEYYFKEVLDWQGIVELRFGVGRLIGLKTDGTIVKTACKDSSHSRDKFVDVSSWRNMCAFSVGLRYLLGVKNDGTLLLSYGQGVDSYIKAAHKNIAAIKLFSSCEEKNRKRVFEDSLNELNEVNRQINEIEARIPLPSDQSLSAAKTALSDFDSQAAEISPTQKRLNEVELEIESASFFNRKRKKELGDLAEKLRASVLAERSDAESKRKAQRELLAAAYNEEKEEYDRKMQSVLLERANACSALNARKKELEHLMYENCDWSSSK